MNQFIYLRRRTRTQIIYIFVVVVVLGDTRLSELCGRRQLGKVSQCQRAPILAAPKINKPLRDSCFTYHWTFLITSDDGRYAVA